MSSRRTRIPSAPVSETGLTLPPLASSTLQGEKYKRRADVQEQILASLVVPRSEWGTMAEAKGTEKLSSEALVFLIRQLDKDERDLCGRVVCELSARLIRIAKRYVQGFDRDTTEEIVWQVEKETLDFVMAPTPSRQSDFLEVAFGTAVERRTINAVAKRRNAPLSFQRASADPSENDERPTESVPDENAGPREIAARLEDEARRPELLKKARAAVKDPRHLEAVILRYAYGWPITDKNPDKQTLARHFGKSGRQIQNWINQALEAMRAALGDTL